MENAPDETSEPDPAAAHRAERARVRAEISPEPRPHGGPTDLSRDAVTFNRIVTSHRFGMGWYVALRRWIDRETRLTAGPALTRLASADRALVRALADERRRVAALEARVARLERVMNGVGATPPVSAEIIRRDHEPEFHHEGPDDPWTPADAAP